MNEAKRDPFRLRFACSIETFASNFLLLFNFFAPNFSHQAKLYFFAYFFSFLFFRFLYLSFPFLFYFHFSSHSSFRFHFLHVWLACKQSEKNSLLLRFFSKMNGAPYSCRGGGTKNIKNFCFFKTPSPPPPPPDPPIVLPLWINQKTCIRTNVLEVSHILYSWLLFVPPLCAKESFAIVLSAHRFSISCFNFTLGFPANELTSRFVLFPWNCDIVSILAALKDITTS